MNLEAIQQALAAEGLDGWLFFDHHRRDPLAYRVLGLPAGLSPSRRWYYFIPATGEPRGLVHAIETGSLEGLPGSVIEVLQLEHAGRRPRPPAGGPAPRRNAVFAQLRHPLRLDGGRGHPRVGAQRPASRWSAPPTWCSSSRRAGPRPISKATSRPASRWIEFAARRSTWCVPNWPPARPSASLRSSSSSASASRTPAS